LKKEGQEGHVINNSHTGIIATLTCSDHHLQQERQLTSQNYCIIHLSTMSVDIQPSTYAAITINTKHWHDCSNVQHFVPKKQFLKLQE